MIQYNRTNDFNIVRKLDFDNNLKSRHLYSSLTPSKKKINSKNQQNSCKNRNFDEMIFNCYQTINHSNEISMLEKINLNLTFFSKKFNSHQKYKINYPYETNLIKENNSPNLFTSEIFDRKNKNSNKMYNIYFFVIFL